MSSGPRVVPHIPFEISKKIADHLDLQSAFNLSLTCKGLRDIGECRIWSGVNLCSTLDLSEDAPIDDITKEQYKDISSQLKSTVSALESHPFRAGCVSSLILPTLDLAHIPHLDRLLDMVHLNLDVLSFILVKHVDEISDSCSTISHVAGKYASDITSLLEILHQSPHIRNLEFGFTNSDSADYNLDQTSKNAVIPSLPSITHISLTHFGDKRLVPALLRGCPELVEFTIKGDWDYGRSSTKAIIRSLKKLEKLKSLNWLVHEGSWKVREAARRFKGLQSYAETCDSMEDESYEMDLEAIEPLTSKSITRLIQTRGMRPSPEAFGRMGVEEIPTVKRRTIRLPADFVHLLYHSPKLTEIIYVRDVPDSSRPTIFRPPISGALSELRGDSALLQWKETRLPADRWEAEGMRGVSIRTYHSSSTGHHFVHVRALTRATEHKGGFYVGEKRQWHDMTRYRGRVVPFTVLREMYEKQGLDLDWADGSRGMKFDPATWEILEKWFEETDPTEEDDSTDEAPPGMEHGAGHADEEEDDDDDDEDDDDDDGDSDDTDEDGPPGSVNEGDFEDDWGSSDDWVDEDEDEDVDEDDIDEDLEAHMMGNGWW